MSTTNTDVFCSGTFKFDVGPSKTRFILHTKLVSRYSDPLHKMISLDMKEKHDGLATLEHIGSETFARFAEYIYSGDYSTASPKKEEELKDDYPPEYHNESLTLLEIGEKKKKRAPKNSDYHYSPTEEEELKDDYPHEYHNESWGKKKKRLPKNSDYHYRLDQSSGLGSTGSSSAIQTTPFPLDPPPGPNGTSAMNYSPTFMCHAHVYAFAEEYLIPDLKRLAANKLSDALNLFECHPQRTGDIARLIRHVYENTTEDDSSPLPLREIVTLYASNNFNVLAASADFKELLKDGGLFVPDVCAKIAELLDHDLSQKRRPPPEKRHYPL